MRPILLSGIFTDIKVEAGKLKITELNVLNEGRSYTILKRLTSRI